MINNIKDKRDRCGQFKCKCMTCKFLQFCATGCNTCKNNIKTSYCCEYGLSVNRAKNIVSNIILKDGLLADKHSEQCKISNKSY